MFDVTDIDYLRKAKLFGCVHLNEHFNHVKISSSE